jgi:cell shape-determining protein MreC
MSFIKYIYFFPLTIYSLSLIPNNHTIILTFYSLSFLQQSFLLLSFLLLSFCIQTKPKSKLRIERRIFQLILSFFLFVVLNFFKYVNLEFWSLIFLIISLKNYKTFIFQKILVEKNWTTSYILIFIFIY